METISDRLQRLRKAHGLSQKDIAEGLGKSPQIMSPEVMYSNKEKAPCGACGAA